MWELFIGCDFDSLTSQIVEVCQRKGKTKKKEISAGDSRLHSFNRKLVLETGGVVFEGHGCLPGSRCFRVAL